MLSVFNLEPGVVYEVVKPFADYYRNQFSVGEKLTYVERNYVPYHGGHTVVFRERKLYLQDDENADLIDSLGEYLTARDLT